MAAVFGSWKSARRSANNTLIEWLWAKRLLFYLSDAVRCELVTVGPLAPRVEGFDAISEDVDSFGLAEQRPVQSLASLIVAQIAQGTRSLRDQGSGWFGGCQCLIAPDGGGAT